MLLLLLCIIFQAVIYNSSLAARTHYYTGSREWGGGAIMHISIEGRLDIQQRLLYKIQEEESKSKPSPKGRKKEKEKNGEKMI